MATLEDLNVPMELERRGIRAGRDSYGIPYLEHQESNRVTAGSRPVSLGDMARCCDHAGELFGRVGWCIEMQGGAR